VKFVKNLVLASLSAASLGAQAAELVNNGSFESISGTVSGYRVVVAGASDISGWTVAGSSVDIINGGYNAISGNSIDMQGSPGPGSVLQTLTTEIGKTYELSFDVAFNPDGRGETAVSYSFGGASGTVFGSLPFAHFSRQYVADSASTILAFSSSIYPGYGGAVLDNVSVTTPVPEPETYAMMLAGLGLMGFVARRRKQKLNA
jgi:choice-of-anchor C domain-containing protein